jgi:hypothetical protein
MAANSLCGVCRNLDLREIFFRRIDCEDIREGKDPTNINNDAIILGTLRELEGRHFRCPLCTLTYTYRGLWTRAREGLKQLPSDDWVVRLTWRLTRVLDATSLQLSTLPTTLKLYSYVAPPGDHRPLTDNISEVIYQEFESSGITKEGHSFITVLKDDRRPPNQPLRAARYRT